MPIFAIPKQNGALAERLGTGLQNLLERFDSARHLKKPLSVHSERGLFVKWYYIGTTFCFLSHFGTAPGTETPRESKEFSGLYEL